jgi:2-methylisocitrate lyase-like PEP mutase family enzyme
MRLVFETRSFTSTTGTWRAGTSVIIENTGASAATVAGKSIAAGESITLTANNVGDVVEFDYDCSSTTLEITAGVRKN